MVEGTTAIALLKFAKEATDSVYGLAKRITDRELKQELNGVYDRLVEIKQAVVRLDEENRALHEQARFKSEDFEFRNPFWYDKEHPQRPLCAKCFAERKAAPMSERVASSVGGYYRQCLVCDKCTDEVRSSVRPGGWEPPVSKISY